MEMVVKQKTPRQCRSVLPAAAILSDPADRAKRRSDQDRPERGDQNEIPGESDAESLVRGVTCPPHTVRWSGLTVTR
jgi:hypothetical protein